MGIDETFSLAFAKAEAAAGVRLPVKGTVFISVANRDRRAAIFPAKRLSDLGFQLAATRGTAELLQRAGVEVEIVDKVSERSGDGSRDVIDKIVSGEIEMVLNTPFGRGARSDGYFIRTAAIEAGVPCITTIAGMAAAVQAIEGLREDDGSVRPLQDYLRQLSYGEAQAGC